MSTLHELAIKHGSDKAQHGYCQFYEQHLLKNPKKLLEIGVLAGASIRMWKEYFPNTEIHAIDLFEENPIPNIEGVVWHKGNQCDWLLLEWLRNENFDVIIDDGSHNARDQMITFFGMFNGKQYYIEDIHCNKEEFYRQGMPYRFTAENVFSCLEQDRNIRVEWATNIVLINSL